MNWGHKITISFVLFVALIASMVVICVRQDIFLVAPDYYKQEIEFDTQRTKIGNFQKLSSKPLIQYSHTSRITEINFPERYSKQIKKWLGNFFPAFRCYTGSNDCTRLRRQWSTIF